MTNRTSQWVVFGGGAVLLLWLYSQTQAGQAGASPFLSLFGPQGGAGGPGGTKTPAPTGGGGGVLADIGKAVGAVGTVAGLGKVAYGVVAPKLAETPSVASFGVKETIQTAESITEKAGYLISSGGVGASEIAGSIGGQSVTWGEIAANPELVYAIAAEGTAATTAFAEFGSAFGVEMAGELAASGAGYAALEAGATGAAVAGAEAASVYTGVTAATMAEISGAVGASAAVGGTEAAGVGAASTAAAGVGLAAGLVAIPFLVLAAVNMVEQAKVAAQLAERGAMMQPIFTALTVEGAPGAKAWLEASAGWANTGRDNNYATLGMRVLDMLAFPNARAENPTLTDESMAPWEPAMASRTVAMLGSPAGVIRVTGAIGESAPYLGVSPSPAWYLRILSQGRYPSRDDYTRLTVADLDAADVATAMNLALRYVDWGSPLASNPFENPMLDTGR